MFKGNISNGHSALLHILRIVTIISILLIVLGHQLLRLIGRRALIIVVGVIIFRVIVLPPKMLFSIVKK